MERVFTQTFGVVGAIVEKDDKFLLVQENAHTRKRKDDVGKWNHPAGWIDVGETIITAVQREVKEETGHTFTPKSILGIYSLVRTDLAPILGATPHAIKIIFTGSLDYTTRSELSEDVSDSRWFTAEEIYAMTPAELRDADIKQMVRDYLAGKKYPLDLVTHTST